MLVSIELDGFDSDKTRYEALIAAGIGRDAIIQDKRGSTGAVEVDVERATASVVADLAARCQSAGLQILSINCS